MWDELDFAKAAEACAVCGAATELCCSKCEHVYYCSEDHQILHWSQHKVSCTNLKDDNAQVGQVASALARLTTTRHDDPTWRNRLRTAAIVSMNKGRYDDALVHALRAYRLAQSNTVIEPAELTVELLLLCRLCILTHSRAQGREYFQTLRKVAQQEFDLFEKGGGERKVSWFFPLLCHLACVLGELALLLGLEEDADHFYEQYLTLTRRCFGDDHLETADAYNAVGAFFFKTRRYTRALPHVEEAKRIRVQQLGGRPNDKVADVLANLGLLHRLAGDRSQALVYFDEAMQIRKSLHGAYAAEVVDILYMKGACYSEMGESDKARAILNDVVEFRTSELGEYHPRTRHASSLLNSLHASTSSGALRKERGSAYSSENRVCEGVLRHAMPTAQVKPDVGWGIEDMQPRITTLLPKELRTHKRVSTGMTFQTIFLPALTVAKKEGNPGVQLNPNALKLFKQAPADIPEPALDARGSVTWNMSVVDLDYPPVLPVVDRKNAAVYGVDGKPVLVPHPALFQKSQIQAWKNGTTIREGERMVELLTENGEVAGRFDALLGASVWQSPAIDIDTSCAGEHYFRKGELEELLWHPTPQSIQRVVTVFPKAPTKMPGKDCGKDQIRLAPYSSLKLLLELGDFPDRIRLHRVLHESDLCDGEKVLDSMPVIYEGDFYRFALDPGDWEEVIPHLENPKLFDLVDEQKRMNPQLVSHLAPGEALDILEQLPEIPSPRQLQKIAGVLPGVRCGAKKASFECALPLTEWTEVAELMQNGELYSKLANLRFAMSDFVPPSDVLLQGEAVQMLKERRDLRKVVVALPVHEGRQLIKAEELQGLARLLQDPEVRAEFDECLERSFSRKLNTNFEQSSRFRFHEDEREVPVHVNKSGVHKFFARNAGLTTVRWDRYLHIQKELDAIGLRVSDFVEAVRTLDPRVLTYHVTKTLLEEDAVNQEYRMLPLPQEKVPLDHSARHDMVAEYLSRMGQIRWLEERLHFYRLKNTYKNFFNDMEKQVKLVIRALQEVAQNDNFHGIYLVILRIRDIANPDEKQNFSLVTLRDLSAIHTEQGTFLSYLCTLLSQQPGLFDAIEELDVVHEAATISIENIVKKTDEITAQKNRVEDWVQTQEAALDSDVFHLIDECTSILAECDMHTQVLNQLVDSVTNEFQRAATSMGEPFSTMQNLTAREWLGAIAKFLVDLERYRPDQR